MRTRERVFDATTQLGPYGIVSVKGSVPAPEHSIDSWTHSFMFTPDATTAAIVGILD